MHTRRVCSSGRPAVHLLQSVVFYRHRIPKVGMTTVMQENVLLLGDTGYGATYSQMVQEEGKKNTVCIHTHIHRKIKRKCQHLNNWRLSEGAMDGNCAGLLTFL